jgi:hypothetical protein
MLECTLFNYVTNKIRSLFENVILGRLKSVFQLDHQIDVNFYLMEATSFRCSRELVGLTPF